MGSLKFAHVQHEWGPIYFYIPNMRTDEKVAKICLSQTLLHKCTHLLPSMPKSPGTCYFAYLFFCLGIDINLSIQAFLTEDYQNVRHEMIRHA